MKTDLGSFDLGMCPFSIDEPPTRAIDPMLGWRDPMAVMKSMCVYLIWSCNILANKKVGFN